jgi:predicted amidohydrolase
MARKVCVAAVQFPVVPVPSFEEFARQVVGFLDQAVSAQIVVFPELFTVGLLGSFPDWRTFTTSDLVAVSKYTAAYLEFFGTEARSRHQVLVAGTHLVNEDGRYFNVCHAFCPDGRVFRHRKTHVFPAERQWSTEEGEDLTVFEVDGVTVGVTICYEAEIPECPSILAAMGAELILCPSYTFTEFGFWRVRHCCQANAVSNQVYVVHACAVGNPGGPLPNGWGRSAILSPCDVPWPTNGILAEAQPGVGAVILADLDLDQLHANRLTGAAPTYCDRFRRRALYQRYEHAADVRSSVAGCERGWNREDLGRVP